MISRNSLSGVKNLIEDISPDPDNPEFFINRIDQCLKILRSSDADLEELDKPSDGRPILLGGRFRTAKKHIKALHRERKTTLKYLNEQFRNLGAQTYKLKKDAERAAVEGKQ